MSQTFNIYASSGSLVSFADHVLDPILLATYRACLNRHLIELGSHIVHHMGREEHGKQKQLLGARRAVLMMLERLDGVAYPPLEEAAFQLGNCRPIKINGAQVSDYERGIAEMALKGYRDHYADKTEKPHVNQLISWLTGTKLKETTAVDNPEPGQATKPAYPAIWDMEIHELGLLTRATNCLVYAGELRYVGEVVQRTEEQLLSFANLGQLSLQNIVDVLKKNKLKLGTDTGNWQPPQE